MPVPVISVAQMREWEQATWAAGRAEADVIRWVGQLVARRALALTRPGDGTLLLAGKGHNGDDVREAAPHLANRQVRLLNVSDPAASLGELQTLLTQRPALVIDGLFGIGLNRALDPNWIRFVETINQSRCPVLAVDVPSGLDADTSQPQGAAVRASVTLTLGAPKHGLLALTATPFVGRLEVAPDIGLVRCPQKSELMWTLPEDFFGFPPARPVDSHKGSFGHLVIFAGSVGYHGAAVLAARAAGRAMPGLVTVFTPENVYAPVAAQLQSAMVVPWRQGARLPDSTSAILIGPGLAAGDLPGVLRAEATRHWQESPLPVVADASALDWLPVGPTRSTALRVITPHPGEAARMLRVTTAAVQSDRSAALRELSRRWGNCWVALKGHHTLVGRNAGEIFINPSGNPQLAQGGSGDALAGYLAGLLAQPLLQGDPLTTIRFGVWQHGAAADQLSAAQRSWTVEELIARLGNAV
ncbi:MAG: NAD(P)H-hydrate dehydratase [Verrucomicrobia bacterium]|nr:NAD(P)H-hydrate dehydratase [Verrucomicrobiota bacterium]